MSRIGKKPVQVPNGVKVNISGLMVTVEGPKGKLSYTMRENFKAEVKDNSVIVTRPSDLKSDSAFQGLARNMIRNMIIGVSEGFSKKLEIQGVGYKAQVQGKTLLLQLGFTHPINFAIPEGIVIEAEKPTNITVRGIDKQKVGQAAADIRAFYKPEPYKGKGIRYSGEYVRKKAGKTIA